MDQNLKPTCANGTINFLRSNPPIKNGVFHETFGLYSSRCCTFLEKPQKHQYRPNLHKWNAFLKLEYKIIPTFFYRHQNKNKSADISQKN